MEADQLIMYFGHCFNLLSLKGRMPAVGQEVQAVPLPQVLVGCGGSTLRTLQGSKCKLNVASMGSICYTCSLDLSVFGVRCQCSGVYWKT